MHLAVLGREVDPEVDTVLGRRVRDVDNDPEACAPNQTKIRTRGTIGTRTEKDKRDKKNEKDEEDQKDQANKNEASRWWHQHSLRLERTRRAEAKGANGRRTHRRRLRRR